MAGLMRDAAPGLACWMGGCSCSPSSRRRPRRAWRSAGASIPGRRLRTTMSVTLFITVVVTPAGHDIDVRDISHFSGRNCNRISAICPLCLGSKRGTPPPLRLPAPLVTCSLSFPYPRVAACIFSFPFPLLLLLSRSSVVSSQLLTFVYYQFPFPVWLFVHLYIPFIFSSRC